MELTQKIINRWKDYRNNPVLFAHEVMDLKPDENQQLILNTIAQNDRTAIRSGHGIGKTFSVGGIIVPWFLSTRKGSKIITTAPTWKQVKEIMWSEIHARVNKSKLVDIVEMLDVKAIVDEDWYAIGISSDEPHNIEGFHAPYILYIVDEAKGVPDEILDALEGALTTEAKVVYISTPGAPEGKYYRAFTSKSSIWKTLHIPSAKKINGKWMPNSDWISQKWIDERLAEWGEESPLFKMRVLGEFVEEAEDALILLKWLEKSAQTYQLLPEITKSKEDVTKRVMGIDVADMGIDLTVFQIVDWMKNGTKIRKYVYWHGRKDTMQTSGEAWKLINEWAIDDVHIDAIGVGTGVAARLKELAYENQTKVNIHSINVGMKPLKDRDKFMNRKAEYWWSVRQQFELGEIIIPDSMPGDLTYSQLSTMKWEMQSNEKIKIIDPKDKSPDFADSLMLAVNRSGNAIELLDMAGVF